MLTHTLLLATVSIRIQRVPAHGAAVSLRKCPAVHRQIRAKLLTEWIIRHCAQALRLVPVAAVVFFGEVPFLPEAENLLDRHALAQVQNDSLPADIRRRNEPLVACPRKGRAEPQLLSGLSVRAPEGSFKCDLPGFLRCEGFFVTIVKFLGKPKLSVVKPGLHRMDIFPRLCHRAQVEGKHKLVERRKLLVA